MFCVGSIIGVCSGTDLILSFETINITKRKQNRRGKILYEDLLIFGSIKRESLKEGF